MEFSVRLTDVRVSESVFLFFFSTEPLSLSKRDREANEVSEDGGGEGGMVLALLQSGAGVYRGQLRWREGGERVQVVQQVPV